MFCLMVLPRRRRERLCLLCLLSAGFTVHAGCTGNAPTPRTQDQIASAPHKSDQIASAPYKPAPTGELAELDMPVRLKAGNEFIDTGKDIAHAGPLLVDLDADGKLDLLVGNFHGHFQVYMNTGTRAEPEYEDKGLLEADGQTAKVPNW